MKKKPLAMAITLTCTLALSTACQAQDDDYPNEVDTHIGKLTFDHGVPTEETSEKLYYELDYHRAVQRNKGSGLVPCPIDVSVNPTVQWTQVPPPRFLCKIQG